LRLSVSVTLVYLRVAIALCAQVTVTPEDNKIAVFNNGNPQG